jgi:hypothetical protein
LLAGGYATFSFSTKLGTDPAHLAGLLTPEDAVAELLDDNRDHAERLAELGETITVYHWAGMQIEGPEKNSRAALALDQLVDQIEEEYGDPEGYNQPDVTDAMKAAARAFVDAVLADYEMWACECVCERQVKKAKGKEAAAG